MNSAQHHPRATSAHRLTHLVRALAPVILFFFAAFLVIFLIFKLFGREYSIEFSAVSKAAVAALVLGKLIPLLDWAQSGYRFNAYRPAVVVACKTLIYALVVILLGIGEKIFHAARQTGSVQGGIDFAIAHANLDRFLGIVLLISLVVGSYLVLQEVDRAMGKGALLRLFFERPRLDETPRNDDANP